MSKRRTTPASRMIPAGSRCWHGVSHSMLDTLDTLAAAVSRNGGYDFGVAGVRETTRLPDHERRPHGRAGSRRCAPGIERRYNMLEYARRWPSRAPSSSLFVLTGTA